MPEYNKRQHGSYSDGSIKLFNDFYFYEGKGQASPVTEQRLNNFVRPFFNLATKELSIPIENTAAAHFLMTQMFAFIRSFILTHGQRDRRAPSHSKIGAQVTKFINLKKKDADIVPLWVLVGGKPKRELMAEHLFERRFCWSEETFPIDQRLAKLKALAGDLLGITAKEQKRKIIFSVEHPDVPHAASSIVPLIKEMKTKGVDVEIIRGAFRYSEGQYKGKVIKEISLLCHYIVDEQEEFILSWAKEYKQQSYLHVDNHGLTTSIKFSGDRYVLGYWTKVNKISPKTLKEGEGFSILNGEYFQAVPDAARKVA